MCYSQYMQETWKSIPGYERFYEASNLGRIKTIERNGTKKGGVIRSGNCKRSGYYYITMSKNGKNRTPNIHRLIATTFILNPKDKPQVNHKDGNKLNNIISNLEWCTASENIKHAYKNGLKTCGEKFYCAKLTEKQVLSMRKEYKDSNISQRKLASKYKIHQSTVWEILARKTWKHI